MGWDLQAQPRGETFPPPHRENPMTEELITTNPSVMLGKLVIRGTRITVEVILERIAGGETGEQILLDFPPLNRNDVRGAVDYALRMLKLEV